MSVEGREEEDGENEHSDRREEVCLSLIGRRFDSSGQQGQNNFALRLYELVRSIYCTNYISSVRCVPLIYSISFVK